MKRINPDTGQPFKRGDKREDGKVFLKYSGSSLRTGFAKEEWVTPEKLEEIRSERRAYMRKHGKSIYQTRRDKVRKLGIGKRRLNPATGAKFNVGFKDETTGKIFRAYDLTTVLSSGFFAERWASEAAYIREKEEKNKATKRFLAEASNWDKLKISIQKSKRRARDKKQEFSVSTEYLLSIYPEDELCPVFGIKMQLGGDRQNSPSLDRIDNAKGYIEGNVVWMSYRANFVKGNSNPDEILALADWLKSQNL